MDIVYFSDKKTFFFIYSKLSQMSISFKILSKNILMGFSMIVNQKKIWWSVYLWKNCFQEADPDHQWRLLMTSMVFIKVFMINGTLNAPYPVRSLKLGGNTHAVNNWSCIFTFGWRLKDILLLANYRSRMLNLFWIHIIVFCLL